MKKTPTKIPQRLWKYFWDVNVKKLNPQEKPYFVINRLLDKGDDEAVRWVTAHFSQGTIQETFKKIRDFRAKIGYFWALYLHIPEKDVLCIQEPYRKVRRMHWPY